MLYSLLQDDELLNLMKENDSIAFKEIYLRHWRHVFLVAYHKIKSKEIAEEISQNIFVSLWERRGEVNILNLKHYLLRSAKFSIINHYKSQMVQERYVNYVQGNGVNKEYSTEQLVYLKDLSAAVEKGMALLPTKTQEVFKLSRVENYSVKEISKTLNISEKAVEYHITQSLKLMKHYLKDYLLFILVFILIQ
jgi:RNA polymerase sigma-70 factor (ECF subfamily)